jgi:cytochrome c oxidase subunit II
VTPPFNPVAEVDRAFLYIFGVSLFLLFGITATMIGFVFRYSRKRNPVPTDIRGNVYLEVVWMVIPTLIALSMFVVGWRAYVDLRTVPPGALQIGVVAESFFWTFTYPNGKHADKLIVPAGRPVKLNIGSRDVIHSLFIPAFRVKADAVRGLKTYVWFYPEKKGTFTISCAEYCGSGHAAMNTDLRIVEPVDYEAWLAAPEENKPQAEVAGRLTPEVMQLFEPAGMQSLEDKMTFSWRVDGQLLHVRMKAPALGWVAAGFNPSVAMKGAGFVIGYVQDGQVFASDEFGMSEVEHESDESLGGQRRITNVFGSETDGFTEIGFSLPLDSGDALHPKIDPSAETTVLLAYSANMDNFRSKHSYRAAFKVNLATGKYRQF